MLRAWTMLTVCGVLLLSSMACNNVPRGGEGSAAPPVAAQHPFVLEEHGHQRVDNYYWLRERDNPEVINYLEAENEYAAAQLAHTEDLQEVLFREIKGRVKQDDRSVPYLRDGYYYYTRTEEGRDYPIYCRKKGSLDAPEQVMVDANEMAEGHEFCSVRASAVSPNQQLLAYAVDNVGRRFYTIRFRNLDNGRDHHTQIENVTGSVVWAADNKTIFFTRQDPKTLRSYQVYRHRLGDDPSKAQLIYEETDTTFTCHVSRTRSKKYLLITSDQTLTSEVRFLRADQPMAEFQVFLPRRRGHEYSVDHYGGKFYVRSNHEASNFRLLSTPESYSGERQWNDVVPHRDDVLLSGFEIFRDHLVVSERYEGLRRVRILPWEGEAEHAIDFGEPTYSVYVSRNPDPNTDWLRYSYTSLTTPRSTFDYNMRTREKRLLKQDHVLGDFAPTNYKSERVFAKATDGTRVPISLVYREGTELDGSSPALLYGYGSYGSSSDARFSASRLSLIDRGFVYAIAHVRGGQEMGRHWYENGKLLKKKNSFTDFIACGEFLVQNGYTSSERLYAQGGSAGGLLVGAAMNMAPELFDGVIASVPWVDVVTTMLDDSIPLTTSEYDEWGDPRDKTYYEYMLSYSPYDNVEKKDYPNLLVRTGLHDSQVQYFEPAKWVAKMRAMKTDENLLIFKTNMSAGHGGASGRYGRYRETAMNYAFLLDLAGKADVVPGAAVD